MTQEKQSLYLPLGLHILQATRAGAIATIPTMGRGDEKKSDSAAVMAEREVLRMAPMKARVVIGEGERDQAPMLYIGEKLGLGYTYPDINGGIFPEVDIATDPLEGTRLCAFGKPGAICTVAIARRGGFLEACDTYAFKITVPEPAKGRIDPEAPVKEIALAIAKSQGKTTHELRAAVLDRPRNMEFIRKLQEIGVSILYRSDGDLSAGISALIDESGIDFVIGIGGSPEGSLAAVASKCLNGETFMRFLRRNELTFQADLEKIPVDMDSRLAEYGINQQRFYSTDELVPGENIVFAASGVTNGEILPGTSFFGKTLKRGIRVWSLLLAREGNQVYISQDDTSLANIETDPKIFFRFKK